MSAYLDSLAGGYDGTETGGVGDVAPTMTATDSNGGGYFSGTLQSLTSLGTGYLARRMDIDLMTRIQGAMPQPNIYGTQSPLIVGARGAPLASQGQLQGQQPMLLNLNALLPFLLVGGVVFMIARKAG